MITIEEFAKKLDGCKYLNEISDEIRKLAKELNYVIVYGYSDDNAEFDGAIYDEVPCWEGGLIYNKNHKRITARWCKSKEYSWTYYTKIPHATFDVYEGNEKFCQGLVMKYEDMI